MSDSFLLASGTLLRPKTLYGVGVGSHAGTRPIATRKKDSVCAKDIDGHIDASFDTPTTSDPLDLLIEMEENEEVS